MIAFGVGMLTQIGVDHYRLVADPCRVKVWNPNLGFFDMAMQPIAQCVKFSEERTYSGVWHLGQKS